MTETELSAWREAMLQLAEGCDTGLLLDTDPVLFMHRFHNPLWKERLAFVASGLAFGGVAQIKGSISKMLDAIKEPLNSNYWDARDLMIR